MNLKMMIPIMLVLAVTSAGASAMAGFEYYKNLAPEEVAVKNAMKFVANSPTYRFDGSELEFDRFAYAGCPECYVVYIDFTSNHGGYGDREGQMLIQMITEHKARISVSGGKIVSAILDDEWDMVEQKMSE